MAANSPEKSRKAVLLSKNLVFSEQRKINKMDKKKTVRNWNKQNEKVQRKTQEKAL